MTKRQDLVARAAIGVGICVVTLLFGRALFRLTLTPTLFAALAIGTTALWVVIFRNRPWFYEEPDEDTKEPSNVNDSTI